MDETQTQATLRHYWAHMVADADVASALYHVDAVLEFPQSQERFVGRENFETWRRKYPAVLDVKVRRISGRADLWITELSIRYDQGPWQSGCSIMRFVRDKVAHETIYVGAGWAAPDWRAPWRAAWIDDGPDAQPLNPPSAR